MPTRMIRDALIESDRWLNLAHPAERLAYVVLLLKADDLGTADATDGQLVRLWREPCNLKGREDAQRILQALADADLVRLYEADGKRLVFIPRFRQRFRARTFRRLPPPETLLHDEPDILENIRQINNQTRKLTGICQSLAGQLPDDGQAVAPVVVVVGEGVDVGEVETATASRDGSRSADEPQSASQEIIPNGTGWTGITEDDRQVWAAAYPAISIESELNAALAWIRANPRNKKSKYRRFLTNWLKRAQDRAPRKDNQTAQASRNRYVYANA